MIYDAGGRQIRVAQLVAFHSRNEEPNCDKLRFGVVTLVHDRNNWFNVDYIDDAGVLCTDFTPREETTLIIPATLIPSHLLTKLLDRSMELT